MYGIMFTYCMHIHRWADIFGLGEPPLKFSSREGAKNAKQGGSHYIRILATEGGANYFDPLKRTPEMHDFTVFLPSQ